MPSYADRITIQRFCFEINSRQPGTESIRVECRGKPWGFAGTAGAGNRFAPADFNPVNRFARFLPPSRQAGPGRSVIFWGSSEILPLLFAFYVLLYFIKGTILSCFQRPPIFVQYNVTHGFDVRFFILKSYLLRTTY